MGIGWWALGTLVPTCRPAACRTFRTVDANEAETRDAAPDAAGEVDDVEALAARLRHHLDAAGRGNLAVKSPRERRFLLRLAGALSAYDLARTVLTGETDLDRNTGGRDSWALSRLACPDCEGETFEVVAGGGTTHLVCGGCGSCWRPENRSLQRVEPRLCPGCDRLDACLAQLIRTPRLSTPGDASGVL